MTGCSRSSGTACGRSRPWTGRSPSGAGTARNWPAGSRNSTSSLTLAPGTVLDGEIVVMTGGKPDMQALLQRLQAGVPRTGTTPVTYIIFDILERDGKPLTGLPLFLRRKQLEAAVQEGSHVVLSEPVAGRGEDYYRAAVAQGLEGVMAKRRDSRYQPGIRSGMWLKVRAQKSCDCVIAGYTPGRGSGNRPLGHFSWGCTRTICWSRSARSEPASPPGCSGSSRSSSHRSRQHCHRPGAPVRRSSGWNRSSCAKWHTRK